MELRFAVKSETQCAYCVCYLYLSTLTKFDLYRLGLECCNNEVMKVVSKFNFVRKKYVELEQNGRYFSLFISQAERKQGSYCFIQDKEFYGGRVSFLDRFFSIKREAIIFCENCRFGKISLYLRFRVCSSQAFCKRMK